MSLRRMAIGMSVVLCIGAGSGWKLLKAQTAEQPGTTDAAATTESTLMALRPADRAARYADLKGRTIQTFSNADMADYLLLRSGGAGRDEREQRSAGEVMHYALKAIGQPYRLGADRFDHGESDCLVLAERTLALSMSYDWNSYRLISQRLRYKDGVVRPENRNYYTTIDWARNNSTWLLTEVTEELGVPTIVAQEMYNRRAFLSRIMGWNENKKPAGAIGIEFGAFGDQGTAQAMIADLRTKGVEATMQQETREQQAVYVVLAAYPTAKEAEAALWPMRAKQTDAKLNEAAKWASKAAWIGTMPGKDVLSYPCVAREQIPQAMKSLQSGDVMLVLRPNKIDKTKVDCDHMGLIDRDGDGNVYFVHSVKPSVRREPLTMFMTRCKWITALRFLRVRDDARTRVNAELARLAKEPTIGALRSPSQEDARVLSARGAKSSSGQK